MNLPISINFPSGASVDFEYDAAGNKLQKIIRIGATIQSRHYYVGGIEYRKTGTGNTRIEAIYHAEGRYSNLDIDVDDSPTWRKEYALRDHLGNTRLMFADKNANGIVDVTNSAATSDILQENHYYPFGLSYEGGWLMNDAARDNKYQFNSKELNDDFGLNLYAYGKRWYDPAIGRFVEVDPIAGDFAWVNPYNYAENEPIANIDLHGLQKASIKDKAIGFAVGMINAFTSDMVGGAGRMDPSTFADPEVAEYVAAGQKGGDILGIFVGGLETGMGGEAVIVGVVGAPETGGVSLGISAAGVGLIGHGLSTQGTALSNLMGGDRVNMEIDIPDKDKIPRGQLNKPNKKGNAPTSKDDNTSIEIHHEGQNPSGPFREMTRKDHRGKGNDKINHPNKNKPSKIDRKEFDKARREYWENEFDKWDQ